MIWLLVCPKCYCVYLDLAISIDMVANEELDILKVRCSLQYDSKTG